MRIAVLLINGLKDVKILAYLVDEQRNKYSQIVIQYEEHALAVTDEAAYWKPKPTRQYTYIYTLGDKHNYKDWYVLCMVARNK